MKKALTWLMVVCTMFGFIQVFGMAAAAQTGSVPATAESAVLQSEEEFDDPVSGGLFGLLLEWLKSIGINLRTVSVNDLLKLPANVMDDVVTYIFAVLKVFGVNVEALYEKLASVFFFK